MPGRGHISSVLVMTSASAMLAGCGPADAQPPQMEEAARACGIRAFAVTPSDSPGQTPYALNFDTAEPEIDAKLDCYGNRLEMMGLTRTLGFGSAGFDPRADRVSPLVSARQACGLPWNALATNGETGDPIIFARGIDRRRIDCAVAELGKSSRPERIDIRPDESPPPPPTIDVNVLSDRN